MIIFLTYKFGLCNFDHYLFVMHTSYIFARKIESYFLHQQLHENNELAALERKWFYDRGQCWDKGRDILGKSRKNTANYSMLTSIFGGSGVTLRMFSGPLIFLLIGFILAALVTVAEIVFYKYKGQVFKAFNKLHNSFTLIQK